MCKGSDAVMLPRIRAGTDQELLDATDRNLHSFSVKGLRTLVVASKVCSQGLTRCPSRPQSCLRGIAVPIARPHGSAQTGDCSFRLIFAQDGRSARAHESFEVSLHCSLRTVPCACRRST